MPLFCYVHRRGESAPYFEVLPELDPDQAQRRAMALMGERPDAIRAELWDGEKLVWTLEREGAA